MGIPDTTDGKLVGLVRVDESSLLLGGLMNLYRFGDPITFLITVKGVDNSPDDTLRE